MKLDNLRSAPGHIGKAPAGGDLRATAYLASYPGILSAAGAESSDDRSRFLQVAALTYGWMPRVMRLDLEHIESAVDALAAARTCDASRAMEIDIPAISASVRSIVGASKMLHFVNPEVYPIWDSRIEGWRIGKAPCQAHMRAQMHYQRYVQDVHAIRTQHGFGSLYSAIQAALDTRLDRLGIARYAITQVRAIELAAFELSAVDTRDSAS